ncbi:hypothetical protein F2Q70_00011130 [Brassica cretica]|uniref:Uncharacterized protein n=1 Tax=Brassica cretica TaxID=69181 RepID=A0A8S9M114_BRACR|nr:hypothetical protein F2Q70_00011130 [Brassica cretica]
MRDMLPCTGFAVEGVESITIFITTPQVNNKILNFLKLEERARTAVFRLVTGAALLSLAISDSSQALSPKLSSWLSLTIQGWMEKIEKRWSSDGEDGED